MPTTPPSPTIYSDPIIAAIVKRVRDATGNAFKEFYQGDPIRIPVSKMPALIIARRQTSTSYITNAEDQHEVTFAITVVTDIRKDISLDTALVPGMATLYDLIEGRDPTTLQLKPSSLMAILRHNVDINENLQVYADVSMPTKVDYGMTMGKRAEDSFSVEGVITTVMTCVQFR